MGKISNPPKGRIVNDVLVELAKRRMNMADLANAVGLHYTTVRRFCSGEQSNVNLPILARICETLSIEPGDILRYIKETE